MSKTKINKEKIFLVAVFLVVLVSGIAIFYYIDSGRKNIIKETRTQELDSEYSKTQNTPQESEKAPPNIQKDENTINYTITNINKKDGDVFSIPDEVTFSITPEVEATKISIKNSEGKIVYSDERWLSQGKFMVYLGPVVTEGEFGTILLEGIKGGKVVATKEVRIVF